MGGDTLLSIITCMCTGYKGNLLVYIHILHAKIIHVLLK